MTAQFSGESIKISFELLSVLITPFAKNDAEDTKIREFDEALYNNLCSIRNSEKYKYLIQNFKNTFQKGYCDKSQCRWDFVCTCLQLLKIIRDTLLNIQDEKMKLLSISQKKILESSFQFIVSLGLLSYLLPGIGIELEVKCKNIKNIKKENLKEFTKYKRLCFVIDSILDLNKVDVFHELVMKHLEDVLAALCQLSFAPLKKPTSNNTENADLINLELLEDSLEITEMSYTVWNKLEQNKNKYKECLITLQKEIYKPYIIRKLLILFGSKNMPQWMKKNLVHMLTNIILEKNGVKAIIKAVIEVDSHSSIHWSHCTVVAKLISTTCCERTEDYIRLFVPQFLEILKNERNQTEDYICNQVVALIINLMLSNYSEITEKYLLAEIIKPLKVIETSSEESINVSINQLYNICIVPSNDSIIVPIRIILPVSKILFFLHCQIKDSIWYLKSSLKELIIKLLRESDDNLLSLLFDSFVFHKEFEQIFEIPNKKKCEITDHGGIRLVNCDNDLSELELGFIFWDLIKNISENECLINSIFIYLLKIFINKKDDEMFLEKRIVAIILLTELSEDEIILKQILKNSENIITFVGQLLQIYYTEEGIEDITRVCLTFLTLVLYDAQKKKDDVNWNLFTSLLETIKKYKHCQNVDIKLLAEEVYNLILTRGVIGDVNSCNENSTSKRLVEELLIQSDCEKNIEAARDALLPVRAHALMELISLIKKGDSETIAKKEKILCLFQENMKDKDSFLYLRAIEGIACMATLEPSVVLPLLCQEFNANTSSINQLKIGEILMRTVKLLNEFIFTYKKLLVNTFLNGVKNKDALIRASSLSNLAEVCLLLKYCVEDILYEVLHYVQNVILLDKEVEPRRAAVFLISSLFKGLSTSTFKIMESRLGELYRILKHAHCTDTDEIVRLQAKLSLDVLNEKTIQFLTSKPQFEKKIHIFNPM